jgi:mono/diheme cytochrome c family protein
MEDNRDMRAIAILGIGVLVTVGSAYAGAAEGKALFASKCASCHGANGEGKESIAKMMKVTMRPLASKEVQAKSDADLKMGITMGQGKMKAVAGLSDPQVADIIAHLRTLK